MQYLVGKHFDIVYVRTLSGALKLRKIRNEVVEAGTGTLEQVVWFYTKYLHSDTRAFLVVTSGGTPMGYGLVMEKDGEWTATGGILQDFRRMGVGRILFRYLTQVALMTSGNDVFADVNTGNLPAMKLYISLGYEPIAVDTENSIIKMKWSGKLVSV